VKEVFVKRPVSVTLQSEGNPIWLGL